MKGHGHYTIDVCGDVLVFRLFDAWNLETAEAYVAEQLQLARSRTARPWASVTDLRPWGIAGPDVVRPIQDLVTRLTDLGRTHAAYLTGTSEMLRDLVALHITGQIDGFAAALLRDDREAADWLAAAGFDVAAYRALASAGGRGG